MANKMTHPTGTKSLQLFSPELGAVSVRPDNSVWLDMNGASTMLRPAHGIGWCCEKGQAAAVGICPECKATMMDQPK